MMADEDVDVDFEIPWYVDDEFDPDHCTEHGHSIDLCRHLD